MNWIKEKIKRFGKWILGILGVGVIALALTVPNGGIPLDEFIDEPSPTASASVETTFVPTPTPELIDSVRLAKINQIEDDTIQQKQGFTPSGLLYSEILYPITESKLKNNLVADYVSDSGNNSVINIQFEKPDLDWVNVITLYVRTKKTGIDPRTLTAKLIMGDGTELILIERSAEDLELGWWTEWDSAVGKWTPGQIKNARVEITTNGNGSPILVSSVYLYVEQQRSMTDDFDSYSTGDLDGQGSWSGSTTWDVATAQFDTSPNSAEAGGTSLVEITKSFTGEGDGNQIWFMRASALNSGVTNHGVRFREGTTFLFHVTLNEGGGSPGDIILEGSTSTTITTWVVDTWFKIEVNWQTSDNTVRAQVDDGGFTAFQSTGSTFTNVDSIRMRRLDGTSGTFFVDSFSDPNAVAAVEIKKQSELFF